jgi:hypothetical protein
MINNNKSIRINYKDNIKILKYYKINIPKSRKDIKKKAEKILSLKLCKCINKLNSNFKQRSVGICTKTVFNSKGLKRGTFKCKGKQPAIKFNKTKKITLI